MRFGPAVVEVDVSGGGQRYIDLDASSPVVSDNSPKGSDIVYGATTGAPSLGIWNSDLHPIPNRRPRPACEQWNATAPAP